MSPVARLKLPKRTQLVRFPVRLLRNTAGETPKRTMSKPTPPRRLSTLLRPHEYLKVA